MERFISSVKIGIKIALFLGCIVLFYAVSIFVFKNISSDLSDRILDYFKVLIWPLIILIIIFLFKPNIAKLIEEIEEWEIPMLGKGRVHNVLTQQQETIKTDTIVAQNEGEDFKAIVEAKETKIKALKNSTDQLAEKLTRAQIELDFERIYNLIFASQIDLLLKINNFPEVEFAYISDHYTKAQQAACPTLKDWNVFQYIQFLINNQLIEYKVDAITVSIAQKGKAFLAYLAVMNYKKYGI